MDNAGNCNTAMEKIQRCCAADGIHFDADGNRCRCFPHVINISAQTVVKELKENPSMVVSCASSPTTHPEQLQYLTRYEDALRSDPIGKTRSTVGVLWASGQQCAELREIIVKGNKDNCWNPPLRPVQLLRDVETRWSSLFGMVGRAIELYPVCSPAISKSTTTSYPIQTSLGGDDFPEQTEICKPYLASFHCRGVSSPS